MSQIWMSHVANMNESCRTYEWVMSHIWTSRIAHMNESCHRCACVMSKIWLSHVAHVHESCCTYDEVSVAHMNESCHTYGWVASHIWMSDATHMNESCHTYEWVMSHSWMRHVTLHNRMPNRIFGCWNINESCRTYDGVMSHMWIRHVTHLRAMIHCTSRCWTHEWVMSHIWMNHVTRMNKSCHTYECVMPDTWISHVKLHIRMPNRSGSQPLDGGNFLQGMPCMLQRVAVCCSVLQRVAACCSMMAASRWLTHEAIFYEVCHLRCSVLQRVAVWWLRHDDSLMRQYDAFHWSISSGMCHVIYPHEWLVVTQPSYCNTLQHAATRCNTWHIPLKYGTFHLKFLSDIFHWRTHSTEQPHPQNPPNWNIEIPHITSKFYFNLYREIPRNLSFSMRWIFEVGIFSIEIVILIWSKETPSPRGVFLVTMFPDQAPRGRGPPLTILYQMLRGGSSSCRFLIRKHSK